MMEHNKDYGHKVTEEGSELRREARNNVKTKRLQRSTTYPSFNPLFLIRASLVLGRGLTKFVTRKNKQIDVPFYSDGETRR